MQNNFPACLALTLHYEGGYVDNPADPGGATNLGITRATLAQVRGRAVSKVEVMSLSRAEAADIYRRLYWNAICADSLPRGLDCVAFDCAVNSGPARAIGYLRMLIGKDPKGGLRNEDLAALAQLKPEDSIRQFCDLRLSFLERLKTFRVFGRGWTRRVTDVRLAALAQIGLPQSHSASPTGITDRPAGPIVKGKPMNSPVSAPTSIDNAKPFWASQTVWSSIAVIGSSICGGLLAWRNGDIGGFGASLTALFGGMNAIVGRFRATTKIQ
ncbi:MAG: hypothetical protein KGQ46_12630 [Hyphomicrobiales bacterium]|nr:hypothetical protein [Hyphomicrobiales bacterium]MDE2113794.1 glycoside hydrolase family 108 protein [Hyphomicrobiales bacterium]